MPAQIKDHYKTLEVHPAVTIAEIKKAYRQLAFKYHPDTNSSAYAAEHFHEIQLAYEILSDPDRRKQYDEERWLAGMSNRTRKQDIITPNWILKETQRLARHMAVVDTYRMSHSALHDYIFLLLSPSHMAILQQAGDNDINTAIIKELLATTKGLNYLYMLPVSERLAQLAGKDEDLLDLIHTHTKARSRLAAWERYLPFIIAAITLILCILMFIFGKQ